MSTLRTALIPIAALVCTSCNIGTALDESTATMIYVVNASNTRLDLLIDGDASPAGDMSVAAVRSTPTTPGAHQVRFVNASGTTATVNFNVDVGQSAIAYAYSGTSSLNAAAIADTGSIVPSNKTKLRVSHLSANAGAIEIWRTQPDFPTPVHIMTPFNYLDTSPYLQSDPGVWEVFVTRPGSTTKIATSGPVDIPAGERRTVVLVDSVGVLRLRIVGQ